MKSFVNTSMGKVSYSIMGEGKFIVLIHGYLESIEIWNNFIPLLADKFRILSIDLPGHGESELLYDSCSIDDMAKALEEVLMILDIEKACIVGHSMGGYVSLSFADIFPDRVSELILLNSHPNTDTPEKASNRLLDIQRIENGFFNEIVITSIPRLFASENLSAFSEEVSVSEQIALRTPLQGVTVALKVMANRKDRNYVLEKLSVPICLVFGRRDNLIPESLVNEIIENHPRCKVIWLQESGHMCFVEEKHQTARAITSFLTT